MRRGQLSGEAPSPNIDHCPNPWWSYIGDFKLYFINQVDTHRILLSIHLTQCCLYRVFSCHDGAKLYELRRGLKRTASIFSLSFSPCGAFLACSSNTETVHVFRLVQFFWQSYELMQFLRKRIIWKYYLQGWTRAAQLRDKYLPEVPHRWDGQN